MLRQHDGCGTSTERPTCIFSDCWIDGPWHGTIKALPRTTCTCLWPSTYHMALGPEP